jgi:hypothetical protein
LDGGATTARLLARAHRRAVSWHHSRAVTPLRSPHPFPLPLGEGVRHSRITLTSGNPAP